jgi:hypothetical protein
MINDMTGRINPITETDDKRTDYYCGVCSRWYNEDCVVIDWLTPNEELTCKHCGNEEILKDTWDAEHEQKIQQ